MASVDSLQKLFVEELKDLYDAEKQITRALPKMAKAVSTPELQAAFEEHLRQTEGQIQRLEQAFEHLDMPARGKKCKGMQGLLEEGSEMMKELEDAVLDAALIGAAQKVEHYEMAAYGTARTFATRLGLHEVASLLEQTLDEEKVTDQKLTQIAESMVNEEAAAEGAGSASDGEERGMGRGRQSSTRSMAAERSSSATGASGTRGRSGNGRASSGRSGGRATSSSRSAGSSFASSGSSSRSGGRKR